MTLLDRLKNPDAYRKQERDSRDRYASEREKHDVIWRKNTKISRQHYRYAIGHKNNEVVVLHMNYIQPYTTGSGMWILELSRIYMMCEPYSDSPYPEYSSIEKQSYHFGCFGLSKHLIKTVHKDFEKVLKEYNLTEVNNLSDSVIEKYFHEG